MLNSLIRKSCFTVFFFTLLFVVIPLKAQNVIVVVIDGARYSETFGAESAYTPFLWKTMKPQGTIWTNFRNEGLTKTAPAHASLETGEWQQLDNNGKKRPTTPTVFEYFRKDFRASEKDVAVIVGKKKLEILTHSTASQYGKKYKASFFLGDDDRSIFTTSKKILSRYHPRIVFINFPEVDRKGHNRDWQGYLSAIKTVDSLVYELWKFIQSNEFYQNKTTLFVTNDHGRHDEQHGGFAEHGCDCEGCQHILLLAIGRKIPVNCVVSTKRTQIDLAPTIGELLQFQVPTAHGTSLLHDCKVSEKECCGSKGSNCSGCTHHGKTKSQQKERSSNKELIEQ
jgi:hypothetical protein